MIYLFIVINCIPNKLYNSYVFKLGWSYTRLWQYILLLETDINLAHQYFL